ncbi:CNBP [Mytilus coruscus]|uniref:CNBP n=1 Tax=Mytilus coruscus TaxID=42192 RepID=A0A6J8AY33_MYTCO|nr:CNBP [Mytilus coruscus]
MYASTQIGEKIEEIDLSPFSTIVLQFGRNDAKMREEVFKSKYKHVVQSTRSNGISNIIIGGCLASHMGNFVLRNREIVPGLISSDGVHLTQAGTEKLIDNINRVIKITSASVNLSGGSYQTNDVDGWEPYRYNCGKKNYTLSNCKFDKRIKCFWCNGLGHKEHCICNLRPSTNDSKSCTNGNKNQSKVSFIKNDQNASDQENIITCNVYGHSEKGMKLTCHNIQHILPKIDDIRANFESLGKIQRPDIIVMC